MDVLAALGQADGDPELAEALDPLGAVALPGRALPQRADTCRPAVAPRRELAHARVRAAGRGSALARGALRRADRLSTGDPATPAAIDAARRAVVAVLRSRDRDRLASELDRELLGLDSQRTPRAVAV
jgi:hypothetical protein